MKGKSELTIKTYINEVSQFKKWFDTSYGISFSKFSRINFLEYKNYMKNIRKYSGKTINKKIASLALFNECLIKQEKLKEEIVLKSDYIKIQNEIFSPVRLERIEVEKLRQRILDDGNFRLYLAVTILGYAGLRINELVNLKVSDILINKKIIYVIGKREKFRIVPINQKVETVINEYYRNNILHDNDYIFKSRKGGHISKNVINRDLKKYTLEIKPHDLRHYFSFLLIKRLSIHEVASILGHSKLETTLKYLRIDENEMKEKVYNI
jgi:site-specific recombinase XerD